MIMNDTVDINVKLLNLLQEDDYSGYDPFDMLNSKLLKSSPFYRNKYIRLTWLQLGKRLPINVRPLLGVPKKRNPKGVALCIIGMLYDYKRTKSSVFLDEAISLSEWLVEERCSIEKWGHSCWGYHFDWQARAFYVPMGRPNIITTYYVSKAIYECGLYAERQDLIDIALDSAYFISEHLYCRNDNKNYYAYIPGESAFVHNASLWGAAWCAFAGKRLNDQRLMAQAVFVAHESVREQLNNGSWFYGTRHHHRFIDGFHTGYNLEALCLIRDVLNYSGFNEAIQNGYQFYLDHFFDENFSAKYFDDSLYPVDMHSFSQAIITLIKVGGSERDYIFCKKVVERCLDLMYLPDEGRFLYQITPWYKNRVNYMRWTQAWAYMSLALYNYALSECENGKD